MKRKKNLRMRSVRAGRKVSDYQKEARRTIETANSTPHLGQVGPARLPACHESSNWCTFQNNEKSGLPVRGRALAQPGAAPDRQVRYPATNLMLPCALEFWA